MSEAAADAPGVSPPTRGVRGGARPASGSRRARPTTEQRLLLARHRAHAASASLLIVIGYIGASGTTEFSSQVPYLISGGLLGLGLIVVGAALFLRYSLARFMRFWLLRLIYEERTTSRPQRRRARGTRRDSRARVEGRSVGQRHGEREGEPTMTGFSRFRRRCGRHSRRVGSGGLWRRRRRRLGLVSG